MNETLLPSEFELTVKSDKNNSFKIKILIDNNSFLNFKIETINQSNIIIMIIFLLIILLKKINIF